MFLKLQKAMALKIAEARQLKRVLTEFPGSVKFCFAYGSGAFKQLHNPGSMLDIIFVVPNAEHWHTENLQRNSKHYAQPLRTLGPKVIAKVQEQWGAKVYYNPLIDMSDGRMIKYGVISEVCLVEDLLDWNDLYLAGRLHKPVRILVEPTEQSQLRTALVQNLHSAVHAALLLLPERFQEIDFYKTITSLSYNGDFRMSFGENKDKVNNIVVPQLSYFRELYKPILEHFQEYVDFPVGTGGSCEQDTSPVTKIHHLNHLPRMPQVRLVRSCSGSRRLKDTEDCLRAIAYDPECSEILEECLRNIVLRSSISQSLKGIATAGFIKSFKYSSAKIKKMFNRDAERKVIAEKSNVDDVVKTVGKEDINAKDSNK